MDPDNGNVYANGLLAQVYGHVHNGERAANGKLIAAAPDLLAGLKELFTLMEEGILCRDISKDHEPGFTERMMDFVPRLRKAQAAIEKAEGRP